MENYLFPRHDLAILLAPHRWRWVSSSFPSDVMPVRHARHTDWSRRHAHAHANRELLLVLSGRGYQSLAGRTYPALAGTVFVFDSMEAHDMGYPLWHPPAEHLWLTFVEDCCVAMRVRVGTGKRNYTETWRDLYKVRDLGLTSANDLFHLTDGHRVPPEVARLRCAAGAAFLVLALVDRGFRGPMPTPARRFHDEVIAVIERHIKEANGKGCSLESLARIAGYSKYHFLRIFRAHAGVSLRQYIDDCRARTYRRLAADGMRQKAIADVLGFAHPSALTRWRKRRIL